MIRRGRKAQGGIKKGAKGGQFTITASGKKNYISQGPKKAPAPAAVKKPPFLTRERKMQILKGTVAALGILAYGAAAHHTYGRIDRENRANKLPDRFRGPNAHLAYQGPHPDWHERHKSR